MSTENNSNESLSGLEFVYQENLLLQHQMLLVSGFGRPKQLSAICTLERNQPEFHVQVKPFHGATAPSKLFALAFSILREAIRSSWARAKTCLYAQWCQ
ncbi:MAG: hypothetical protein AB1424_09270 [Thermodesulfobacteriota bacterium]